MQRFLLWAVFLLTLSVCEARDISEDGDNLTFERKELLRVARSLEKSLNELRRLEQAKAVQSGLMDTQLRQPPKGGAMEQIVTIDWEGPLESLLEAIAEKYHYTFKPPIGKKPTFPILVSISTQGKTLGTVIQDLDLQAGMRAHVSGDAMERTIELRYVAEAA